MLLTSKVPYGYKRHRPMTITPLETLTLRLEAGSLDINDLTATQINREFFNGDMNTYEEALEVLETLQDEYLLF